MTKSERTQDMERTITIEETAACRTYELWADAVREEMGCDTIPCPPPAACESAANEESDEVLDLDLGPCAW